MPKMIFVNLPVEDVTASRSFFQSLGYGVNEQFSDDNAVCTVISDTIYAMLLRREFFAGFTPRPVADAHQVTEALIALSADSRADVDATLDRALAAGGREVRDPMEDGPMYARAFSDLDGHIWEVLWMDPTAVAG